MPYFTYDGRKLAPGTVVQIDKDHSTEKTTVYKEVRWDTTPATWVPWEAADLEGTEQWSFVPRPIPGLVKPILRSVNDNPVIIMDVNDLQCVLECNAVNTVSAMFYWAYKNSEQQYIDNEKFKREGPQSAPWAQMARFTKNAAPVKSWYYEPGAATFGISLSGRFWNKKTDWVDRNGLVRYEEKWRRWYNDLVVDFKTSRKLVWRRAKAKVQKFIKRYKNGKSR